MNTNITSVINSIKNQILVPIWQLLFVLATVVFLWGVIQYVIIGGKGDPKTIEQGKKVMIWGLIGMLIMASAWGIVSLICGFFGACNPSLIPGVPPAPTPTLEHTQRQYPLNLS